MTWLTDMQDTSLAPGQASRAMGMPIGMASPLWLAFGAATTAGVAWWLMTRWTQALNLEALAVPGLNHAPRAPTPVLDLAAPLPAPVELAPEPAPTIEPAPEPVALAAPEPEPEPEAAAEPDDLTLLVGIGPKLADALAARGVSTFAQLAAWTAEDLAMFDSVLSLKGRAVRDAWVAQAQRRL